MFDQAMQDAQQTCKMLDETLDADQQDEMFEAASSNKNAGKISKDYIDNITKRIQRISLSMNGVKDRIKKLLDKSASYFSAKDEVVYEDLFNATNVSEIDDYLFLHPKLRKIMVEDVQVKEVKKVGKIDLYIDISGSMDSDSGLKDANGGYMDKLEFCKAFAFKLAEMDMLNKLYLFESYVKEHKTDPISIAMIRSQGGTDIDAAVRSVLNNGNNAIIITDAEDACSIYSEKAFFIGVKGCRFTSFNTDTIKEYSDKDQVIMFDGNKVFKIGERGQVLK
jgi:uncharacterized protein with von Willebrand factor type A (vWA) domain